MKIKLAAPPYVSSLGRTLFAHYRIISFVLAMLTLIYCVYTIQQIMSGPGDTQYYQSELQKNTKTSFDKKTIDRIKALRTIDDNQPVTLPSGRFNPFTE